MGLLIYERNIWPEIAAEQLPRYAIMNSFVISVEIEDDSVADALEKDPLLHQKLIDNINAFVNEKTVKLLGNNVFRTETDIQIQINNSNFDGLARVYREFDVFARYLLAVTNDNTKHIVQRTIDAQVKDKKKANRYKAGMAVKMTYRIGSLLFSTGTLAAGAASAAVSGGVTAIPGLIVGFIGLVQSAAELGRELAKAISSMDQAGADAMATLEKMIKRYQTAGDTKVNVSEVGKGVVNKVFSGFVELDTISTLSGKFDLWESKILLTDQSAHRLARKLNGLFAKMDEIQREIMLAQRPPVPSRAGCKLKVPPPVPSKANRPKLSPSKPAPPPIPSRQGRIGAMALRDTMGLRTPPPVPSRIGRPALNQVQTSASSNTAKQIQSHEALRESVPHTLVRIRGIVHANIVKISDLERGVKKHKALNSNYKKALTKLKSRKTKASVFVESLANVAVGLTKSGISMGLGGFDLSQGLSTASETVQSISTFVVEQTKECFDMSLELADEYGELGEKLREKERLNRGKVA